MSEECIRENGKKSVKCIETIVQLSILKIYISNTFSWFCPFLQVQINISKKHTVIFKKKKKKKHKQHKWFCVINKCMPPTCCFHKPVALYVQHS